MPNKRLIKKRVSGNYDGKKSRGKAKAGILGWILSDGCIHKRPNRNYEITIAQSYDGNREKCEIIEKLLIESEVEHSIKMQKPNKNRFNPNGRMIVFRILSKGKNLDWVLKYLTPEKIPRFNLLTLKNEELRELYNMLMLGDGSYGREFCCQNKEITEFLQILCILIGRRCLMGSGTHNKTGKRKLRTWITEYNDVNVLPSQVEKVDYNGVIWCPTTNNNTWIARRNKKVFITGNSLRHGYATEALRSGIDLYTISKLLGHEDISTTTIYAHLCPEDAIKELRNKFGTRKK